MTVQVPGPASPETDAIRRLWLTLRWHWLVILVVVVAAAGAATVVVDGLPDEYTAEAIVALEPAEGAAADAGLIRLRAPTYVSYLQAEATQVLMAAELGDADARDDLGGVDVELVSDTGTIVVTADATTPERAVALAGVVVDRAADFAADEVDLALDVVAPPVPPEDPSGPARGLLLAAVLVAATLLAVGGALAWDQLRPRLRDLRVLSRVIGVPVLAELPDRRGLALETAATDARMATAVRVLRTHLDGELRLPTTLAVLSATRDEGRSTVVAVLAQALARLDLRVLMVDADHDRAGLSAAWGHERNTSLAAGLEGRRDLGDLVKTTSVDGVLLLPADPNVTADAMSRGITNVLATARESYDVVVVDTPPLLGGDVARTVAVACEQSIVIAAVGTGLTDLEQLAAALESLRVRPVGAVLTRGRGRGAR